jgi:O-antigen/teichoic acid export membrane protein
LGVARVSGITRRDIFAKLRSGQPLTRASIAAFIVFTVGAGLTYVAQLVTARVIGPDSYGVYAYVLAWVTLLAYFSTLGFHVSLLRFIPAYRAKEEFLLVRGVIRYSHLGAAGAATSVVLIGICVILALDKEVRPELASTFFLGMAAVPFLALHLIGASAVRAFGGVVAALVPERIVRDGVLLAIIAAASWSSFRPLDATLAMAAMLAGSVVMLALVRISLRRLGSKAGEGGTAVYTAKEWWRPTLPLTVIMVADNLMSRSGVIVLGLAGNTREAGIFAVAFSMAILTALPRMAVATIFAPAVSDLFTRDDQAGLQSLTAKASWLSLLGTACVAIPLLLLAQPLLAWFGPEFVAGAPIVGILIAGQVFAAGCGPQQHLITMTAHERTGAAILAVCATANLAACLLMISSFGMTGAALAMTATLITWNLAMGTFIYRRLRLKPGLVASLAPLRKSNCAQGYGV